MSAVIVDPKPRPMSLGPAGYRMILMALPIGLALSVPISLALYYRKPKPKATISFAAPRRDVSQQHLEETVRLLTHELGPRTASAPATMKRTLNYLESTLGPGNIGWNVSRQPFDVKGVRHENLIAELKGSSGSAGPIIVATAADTGPEVAENDAHQTPVAAMIALAQSWTGRAPARSIRLLFASHQASAPAGSQEKGLAVYAGTLKALKERPALWIELGGLGRFSQEQGSQSDRSAVAGGAEWSSEGQFLASQWTPLSDRASTAFGTQWRAASQLPLVDSVSQGPEIGIPGLPALTLSDTGTRRQAAFHPGSFFQAVKGLEAALWAAAEE